MTHFIFEMSERFGQGTQNEHLQTYNIPSNLNRDDQLSKTEFTQFALSVWVMLRTTKYRSLRGYALVLST